MATTPLRTRHCALFSEADNSSQASVCGWVASRRDHGGLIFIDLRDHTGILQVVCAPENTAAFAVAEQLRSEYVVHATGQIRRRPAGTINPDLPTGEVELVATELAVLNFAHNPVFVPNQKNVSEELRLTHRAIELRGEDMQHRLRARHAMAAAVRTTLNERQFIDVETPMLTRPTPEGARDFLIPARLAPGSCYALPQSPQLFKQVLMAGGIDRYYQIVRCFRDEDLRSDRQPEFTQIDIEIAFADEREAMAVGEVVLRAACAAGGRSLAATAIPIMSYAEAARRFGTDTPDLRIDLELVDLADLLRKVKFEVFAKPANQDGSRVVGLRVPAGSTHLSRKNIDSLVDLARQYGLGGLAYMKITNPSQGEAGVSSPIAKHLGSSAINAIAAACEANPDDLLLFAAGPKEFVNAGMSAVRLAVAGHLKLVREIDCPVWITEFPLFEQDRQAGRLKSVHHPFSAPVKQDEDKLLAGQDLSNLVSRSYDLVLNGQELGGGSTRIHRREVQLAALQALGINASDAEDQFGFLLNTLTIGMPPSSGIAMGFDRIVAWATKATSIREVIAFPKTQSGSCLFTGAPQQAEQSQLAELGLQALAKPSDHRE